MLPFITIGQLQIPTYGLMLVLAFAGAGIVFYRLAPRAGLPRSDAFNALALMVVGGGVGAKLAYMLGLLPHWRELRPYGWRIWLSELAGGGMVFYGGMIGGLLVLFLYLRHFNLPVPATLDVAAVALPLGQAIGRLGCFSVGCCYGLPWQHGIALPHSLIAPRGIPLVPTQLIESSFCLLLSVALYLYFRKGPETGSTVRLYLLGYGIFRFLIEFLRGDVLRGFIGPLSVSQWISLAAIAFAVLSYRCSNLSRRNA